MRFIDNIKNAYVNEQDEMDRGDIIQTVLIIAIFVPAVIAVATWITGSIMNKGADVADCIGGANTYSSGKTSENCKKADGSHEAKKSFKDGAYKDRFGG